MRYYRSLYLKGLQNWKNLAENPSFIELRIEIAGLLEARVRFPAGADFEGQQLCSPLAYKNLLYLFGNF